LSRSSACSTTIRESFFKRFELFIGLDAAFFIAKICPTPLLALGLIVIHNVGGSNTFFVIQDVIYTATMKREKPTMGRPPKPPEETLKQRSIRLTDAQWGKYDAYGGVKWLRRLIDRAKQPKPDDNEE
jgi:hypothetical protein